MSLSLMSHLRMALATCGFFLALRAEPAFSADPLLGVYGGNSMNHVLDFEQWLGREVDGILCTVDYRTWENYRHADWLSHTVYGNRGQRRLIYDVPIIIEGANYKTAKTGAYDSHWKSLAESIIANNPGDYDIVIRPSHEMNGDWFVWGVGGSKKDQIPDFIASWRRFHGVFRSVEGGHRFRFSFSTTEGADDPRPMWPGDEYVDIVGHDVYWKPKAMGEGGWETNNPREAWRKRVENGYNEWGIGGMLAFAISRGKPFQIDEWGVWGPDAAPFVEAMADFLETHGVLSHTYWNSDADYLGRLDRREDTHSETSRIFRERFGPQKADR